MTTGAEEQSRTRAGWPRSTRAKGAHDHRCYYERFPVRITFVRQNAEQKNLFGRTPNKKIILRSAIGQTKLDVRRFAKQKLIFGLAYCRTDTIFVFSGLPNKKTSIKQA